MNEHQLLQAISKIVNDKLLQEIRESVVFKNDDGDYELYGRYIIKQDGNNFRISTMSDTILGTFSSIKNAVTYVTYDLRCMVYEANRIRDLDNTLIGLEVATEMHEKLYKNSKNSESKLIYLCKLQEDKLKRKKTIEELTQFTRLSYNWQMSKFKREATKTNQLR